jgi:hypothetical protein
VAMLLLASLMSPMNTSHASRRERVSNCGVRFVLHRQHSGRHCEAQRSS